jgi:hypothetical protein
MQVIKGFRNGFWVPLSHYKYFEAQTNRSEQEIQAHKKAQSTFGVLGS